MMQELINNILKILKDHVNQNNDEINLNQEDINALLTESIKSSRENDDLEYKKSLNHELQQENQDFINMQLEISEFMEKYGHLISNPDTESESLEEETVMPYLQQTISGHIEFGPKHPQFSNPEFFTELLRYYEENEDYEKCDQLVKLKTDNNKF